LWEWENLIHLVSGDCSIDWPNVFLLDKNYAPKIVDEKGFTFWSEAHRQQPLPTVLKWGKRCEPIKVTYDFGHRYWFTNLTPYGMQKMLKKKLTHVLEQEAKLPPKQYLEGAIVLYNLDTKIKLIFIDQKRKILQEKYHKIMENKQQFPKEVITSLEALFQVSFQHENTGQSVGGVFLNAEAFLQVYQSQSVEDCSIWDHWYTQFVCPHKDQ